MLRSGDWWSVRFNGSLNFEYPPLFIWLESASMNFLGVTDFAAKFPVALLGLATILLTFYLVLELTQDPWLALISSVVLLSSQYFMKYATHAMTDVPCAFFITLGVWAYVKGLRKSPFFLLAGLALAAAVMTRSIVGLLPLGIFASHVILTRRFDVLRSPYAIAAVLVTFALPGIWFASQYQLHGRTFIDAHWSFLSGKVDSVSLSERLAGFLEYSKLFFRHYWPWLPFLCLGLLMQGRLLQRRRDSSAALFVLWAAWIVIPFSLAEARVFRYLIPAFPCFAAIAATPINQWLSSAQKERCFRYLYGVGAAVVALMFVFPMTRLRATDMKALAPVAEAHTNAGQRVIIYVGGRNEWNYRNQFLWYGNRYSDFLNKFDDVMNRLGAGPQVVIMHSSTFDRMKPELESRATVEVLATSESFVCFRSLPAGSHSSKRTLTVK